MKLSGTFTKATFMVAVVMLCGTVAVAQTTLNPNDPTISSNLQLWLDAGAGITTQDNSIYGSPSSASDVSYWADQSGNGNDVYQYNIGMMPELVTNGMNGQPVVRFEGTGVSSNVWEYLEGTFSTPLDVNTGTMFCVLSMNSSETEAKYTVIDFSPAGMSTWDKGYQMGAHNVGAPANIFYEHYGELIEDTENPGTYIDTKMQKSNVAVDADTPFMAVENYQKAGPIDNIYVNQEQQYVGWLNGRDDTTLLDPVSDILIGARDGGTSWFLGGDIAEIIYYDRQLTSTEQTGVSAYLTDKYGLPEPAPVNEDPGPWPSDYADTIMADSPIAYYRMDEGYGDILHDVSGNGINGTLKGTGAPTYDVANPLTQDADNTALTFNGDSYFEVLDFNGLLNVGSDQDFSIEFWFKTDAAPGVDDTPAVNGLFGKGDTNASVWGRIQSGGIARGLLDYGSSSDSAQDTESVCDDIWHQYVLVADRDTAIQLYIDGELVGEDTDIHGGDIDNFLPLNIALMDNKWYYIGSMDEFALFAEALTLEQIQTHYDAAVGTPDEIPGDANNDGKVDGSDVTILANNWQAGVSVGGDPENVTWAMGDFNGDGMVDGSDVTILANNWQYGVTTAAASVPEPSTLILLLAAAASLLVIRRR